MHTGENKEYTMDTSCEAGELNKLTANCVMEDSQSDKQHRI